MTTNSAVWTLLALGAIAGALTALLAVVRPLLSTLRRYNAALDVLLGDPGIPGIRPATLSAFDRLTAVEVAQIDHESRLVRLEAQAANPNTPAVVQVMTEHPNGA